MQKPTERNLRIDVIKGIAICLVVVGHCIERGGGAAMREPSNYLLNPLRMFIYSFHMPLFMMISGYLFWASVKRCTSFYTLLCKKITGLAVPAFSWGSILYLSQIVLGKTTFNIMKWVKMAFTNFWFICAVFCFSITALAIHYLFNDCKLLYAITFIASLFIQEKAVPYIYKFMYVFFFFGYFINKENVFEKIGAKVKNASNFIKKIYTWLIFSAYAILFVYYNTFATNQKWCIITSNGINYAQLSINAYMIVIGAVGSAAVVIFTKFIVECNWKPINIILSKLGKETLGIYIIHSCMLSTLIKLTENIELNYFAILFEFIIIMGLSYIIIVILNLNDISAFLLLGKPIKIKKTNNFKATIQ